MANPGRQPDDEADDSKRSGARRLFVTPTDAEPLPPTPDVLVARARIVTGQYSIVRPVRPARPRTKPNE